MAKRNDLNSVLVVGGLMLLLGGCHTRTMRLVNPDPILVRSQSVEQTREGIWNALQRRRWNVTAEEPGVIVATVSVRTHSATVRIEYDAGSIRIGYVDSENLKYRKTRKGDEYIHKNYHTWVRHLIRDMGAIGPTAEE